MGKKSKPTPNLHEFVQKAPNAGEKDFIFKWSNELKSYDTSSFNNMKAKKRVSRGEVDQLMNKLSSAGIFLYKIHSNFQTRFLLSFLGLCVLIAIIAGILGLSGLIESGAAAGAFQLSCCAFYFLGALLDQILFCAIKRRGNQIENAVKSFNTGQNRSKRFKVICGSYGAYLKLEMIDLDKIEPQFLVDPMFGGLERDFRSQQVGGDNSNRLNRVTPVPIRADNQQSNRVEIADPGANDIVLDPNDDDLVGNMNDIKFEDDDDDEEDDGGGTGGFEEIPATDSHPVINQSENQQVNYGLGDAVDVGGALQPNSDRLVIGDAQNGGNNNQNKDELEIQDIVVKKESLPSEWDLSN